MPARERIQQEADEATFARRALAVEKERAIAENELPNQIELARREESSIGQRGQNEKKRITDEATEPSASRPRRRRATSRLNADGAGRQHRRARGARASTPSASAWRSTATLPPAALMGLAARELAGKLQSIEHLNLSPDSAAARCSSACWRAGAQAGAGGGCSRAATRRGRCRRAWSWSRVRASATSWSCVTARCSRRASSSSRAGSALDEVLERHELLEAALHAVTAAVPGKWRRARVHARTSSIASCSSPRTSWSPSGRTGSSPTWPSICAGSRSSASIRRRRSTPACWCAIRRRRRAISGRCSRAARCRARSGPWCGARLGDGQTLLALNEIFVGHRTHQSARYRLACGGRARAPLVVGADRGDGHGRDRLGQEHHARSRAPRPRCPGRSSPRSRFSCARRGRA